MSSQHKKQWINKRGAQPVADLVSRLLSPVVEQRAGMTTDLVASWAEIAGARHAAHSRPEKLLWPRQVSDDDPFEPATLILACESRHALFLQHDSSAILGRINTYFGFHAVARLKLVQKPIVRREERSRARVADLPKHRRRDVDILLADITDPKLKAALKRLGQGVFSKGSGE